MQHVKSRRAEAAQRTGALVTTVEMDGKVGEIKVTAVQTEEYEGTEEAFGKMGEGRRCGQTKPKTYSEGKK